MARTSARDESGLALIAVLLAMALITVIGAGLTAVGIVELRASINHRSATQALLLADAGATHAQALLQGPLEAFTYTDILVGDDGAPGGGDDGIMTGYGLDAADALPDTGVVLGDGRYFVTIVNDTLDPSTDAFVDDNFRFLAICRGETIDGGVAEVHVMFAAPSFPAIIVNGPLMLPGSPDVVGPCGGVHANGPLDIDGNPIVSGPVSYSDTLIMDGTVTDTLGNNVTPEKQPPVDVPELNPLDYCDEADYVLKDGYVITVGPPRDSTQVDDDVKWLGWHWDAATNTYNLNANDAVEGTVCAYGSVISTGNLGSPGDPFSLTILATGSVRIGGTPVIEADHSEGLLIVAGGDVQVSGNTTTYDPYYNGLIYARSQCQINGNPIIEGHVLCRDDNDFGQADWIDENKVNGTPRITYDCDGMRQRTQVDAWWESRN
jgi:hypothetical protein